MFLCINRVTYIVNILWKYEYTTNFFLSKIDVDAQENCSL